jgi:hypothetical protein
MSKIPPNLRICRSIGRHSLVENSVKFRPIGTIFIGFFVVRRPLEIAIFLFSNFQTQVSEVGRLGVVPPRRRFGSGNPVIKMGLDLELDKSDKPTDTRTRTHTHTHTHTQTYTHTLPTIQAAQANALQEGNAVAVTLLALTANYFTYFEKTWMPVVKCWSYAGRVEVAQQTGIALDKIPTTNNHLEALNSALKNTYLQWYVLLMCTNECFCLCAMCHRGHACAVSEDFPLCLRSDPVHNAG